LASVRIALVGLDHWYSALPLARAIVDHPEAELAGIYHSDPQQARKVGQDLGIDRVTDHPEELIHDPDVTAIASFVSVDRNPDICIAAAREGKHILSIKPLARTLEESSRVVEAVREAGVVFLPAESRQRLSAQYARLKSWVDEGRLGRILTASFSLWASLPRSWPDDPDPGWFADPNRAPGGGWIDHAIYHIDLLRWLTGSEVARVYGVARNLRYPDLPLEDYGVATVEFESGLVATIEDTWHAAPGAFRMQWSLVGSEGACAYDSLSGRVAVAGSFPPFEGWVHFAPGQAGSEGIDHWIAAMRGEQPIATVEDAHHNLAACVAFYRSAASGEQVVPQVGRR